MELFDTSVLILDKESNEFQLHGLRARSGRPAYGWCRGRAVEDSYGRR
jgi:hypothetical protein